MKSMKKQKDLTLKDDLLPPRSEDVQYTSEKEWSENITPRFFVKSSGRMVLSSPDMVRNEGLRK